MMLVGCNKGRRATAAKTSTPIQDDHVTLNGTEYPLHPGSTLFQDLKISMAYRVEAEPSNVRAWYDEQMAAEGWEPLADWIDFGGSHQKDFRRGERLPNSQFGEYMVKIGVAPHKKGGTHLMILPIINKYPRKPKSDG